MNKNPELNLYVYTNGREIISLDSGEIVSYSEFFRRLNTKCSHSNTIEDFTFPTYEMGMDVLGQENWAKSSDFQIKKI